MNEASLLVLCLMISDGCLEGGVSVVTGIDIFVIGSGSSFVFIQEKEGEKKGLEEIVQVKRIQ